MAIMKGGDPTKPSRKKRREMKSCDMFGSCTPSANRSTTRPPGKNPPKNGVPEKQDRPKYTYKTYEQKTVTPASEDKPVEKVRIVKGYARTSLAKDDESGMGKAWLKKQESEDKAFSSKKNTEEEKNAPEKVNEKYKGLSPAARKMMDGDKKKESKVVTKRKEVEQYKDGKLVKSTVISRGSENKGGEGGEIRVTRFENKKGRELKRPVTEVRDLDKYRKEKQKLQSRRVLPVKNKQRLEKKAVRRSTRYEK